MKYYPSDWTAWMRSCCLAILLVRGGLSVTFRGKGLLVVFLSFVPQLVEATIAALVGMGLFSGMPIEVCYAMAYTFSTVAAAVVVPGMMSLNEKGYGASKGIAGTLIAGCTFDTIICIICFGICKTLVFEKAAQALGHSQSNTAYKIGMLFVENVVGLAVGVLVGMAAWPIRYIAKWKYCRYVKAAYCVAFAIGFILAGEFSSFANSKYIANLSLGYTLSRVWGTTHLPSKELATVWFFIQPFLFGTVGAQLLFSQIRALDVGKSIVILFTAIVMRVCTVILLSTS